METAHQDESGNPNSANQGDSYESWQHLEPAPAHFTYKEFHMSILKGNIVPLHLTGVQLSGQQIRDCFGVSLYVALVSCNSIFYNSTSEAKQSMQIFFTQGRH